MLMWSAHVDAAPAIHVYGPQVREELTGARVMVPLSHKVRFVDFAEGDPPRLIIDIIGSGVYTNHPQRFIVDGDFVKAIEHRFFDGDWGPEGRRLDQITIELSEAFPYQTHMVDDVLVIEIGVVSNPLSQRVSQTDAGVVKPTMARARAVATVSSQASMSNVAPEVARSARTERAEPVQAPPRRDDAAQRFQVEVQHVVQKQMSALVGRQRFQVASPVRMQLVINSAGLLEQVDIVQSSGVRQVDALGWQAAWTVHRYPAPPGGRWKRVPVAIGVVKQPRPVVRSRRADEPQEPPRRPWWRWPNFGEMWPFFDELPKEPPALDVEVPDGMPLPRAGAFTLEECVSVALDNHQPIRTAREDVTLAKMRVAEAKRALFPTANLKWQESRSVVGGGIADSIGRRYNLDFQQPIYRGGELRNAYRQAQVNVSVADRQLARLEAEVVLAVEKAFYKLASVEETLQRQRWLVGQVAELVEQVHQRHEIGMTRMMEVLSAENSRSTLKQTFLSTQHDLQLAQLGLQQAVGVEEPIEIDPGDFTNPPEVDVDLKQCMDVAYAARPELLINRLLVQFSNYGLRVARSRARPQVTLSGTLGHGAENFDTEELFFDNEYFIGLEVSVPWWVNTIKSSSVTQDRIPQAGQVESTEFVSHTLELAILDPAALRARSDRKAAQQDYQKALDQLAQTKQTVTFEVKDAYYRLRKSWLALQSYVDRMALSEEQEKVTTAMVELNEMLVNELLRIKMERGDAESNYLQGLNEYYTAISELNRAIGRPGYFPKVQERWS